jgi:hypothetical protein
MITGSPTYHANAALKPLVQSLQQHAAVLIAPLLVATLVLGKQLRKLYLQHVLVLRVLIAVLHADTVMDKHHVPTQYYRRVRGHVCGFTCL